MIVDWFLKIPDLFIGKNNYHEPTKDDITRALAVHELTSGLKKLHPSTLRELNEMHKEEK